MPIELPAPPGVPSEFAICISLWIEAQQKGEIQGDSSRNGGIQNLAIQNAIKLEGLLSGAATLLFDFDGVVQPHRQLRTVWQPVWDAIFTEAGIYPRPTHQSLEESGLFSLAKTSDIVGGIQTYLKNSYDKDISLDSLYEVIRTR